MAGSSRLVLQPRARRILAALSHIRLIDREHARSLAPFGSAPRANARLLQLVRAGFLARSLYGTINGGRRALYRLPDTRLPRPAAIAHELAISDVYAAFAAPAPVWSGAASIGPVVPDAVIRLSVSGQELPHIIEVDRGTETQAVIGRKADSYLALALGGQAENFLGSPRFRVLIVTTSERRLHHIAATLAARTNRLFWLTTLNQLRCHGPTAAIWQRPGSSVPTMLFP